VIFSLNDSQHKSVCRSRFFSEKNSEGQNKKTVNYEMHKGIFIKVSVG